MHAKDDISLPLQQRSSILRLMQKLSFPAGDPRRPATMPWLPVAIVLLALLPPAPATAITPVATCAGSPYTANGTYQANLESLSTSLVLASASSGFATASAGATPDQAYALALCRGDANASACATCVVSAFRDARGSCPLDKGVTIYRDDCVLRFSGEQFLNFLAADQWIVQELVFGEDAWFSAAVTAILTALVDLAAATTANTSTSARKYFATGEEIFVPRIYGLAQCAPDLTPAQCQECLQFLLPKVTGGLSGRPPWVNSFLVWCNLKYSVSTIYEGRAMLELQAPPAPLTSGSPTPGSGPGKKRKGAAISAGVACSGILVLVLSVSLFLLFRRRIKATKGDLPPKEIGTAKCMIFDFPILQEATENFSEKNKLGQGGFGIVYKGTLSDGQEIAVKKLLGTTGHGLNQLQNEVLILAELQHKNLVRLQGFCSHQNETLLVYEYIKNGSLDSFLFDVNRGNALNWEQQHNIILGIAKGLLYLHEDSSTRIIHRDLKSNNILLDDTLGPKIADFELAKLLGEGHTHTQTSRAAGTLGYMAPEYAILGNVSPKIDIFSFGVLVLEIVTRRSNSNYDDHSTVNLLTEVWDCWIKGTIPQMLDQSLYGYDRSQALRCVHVGLLCVQPEPDDRPDISYIIFMLTRDSMELQSPAQPAFYFGREPSIASLSSGQSCNMYDPDISVNEVTVTEPYPR
ncbi:hypothetical protein ACP4OV_027193 [Aristida adscensionis]